MNVEFLDSEKYHKFFPKYNLLKDHSNWKSIMNEYINKNYYNTKINHDWIMYIVFYEVDDKIHIYFRKFFIKTFYKSSKITFDTIEKLIYDIKFLIKTKEIILSIDFLYDMLEDNIKQDNNILLIKRDISRKLQIKFKFINNKIKFYIKCNEFYECNIDSINELQNKIYKKYRTIERKKKKIILLNNDDRFFSSEDYIYELQKCMYEKNYWLDISFHFNKNSFQNNSRLNNVNLYFIKYDIIILCDVFTLCKVNVSNIHNKIILVIPYKLFYDISVYVFYTYYQNILRTNKNKINPQYQKLYEKLDIISNNGNIFYWGKKNMEDYNNTIAHCKLLYSGVNPTYIKNTSTKIFTIIKVLESSKIINTLNKLNKNKYTKKFNIFKTYTGILNEDLLDKNDFYKINNLDINKKIITIFTRWPKILKEHEVKRPNKLFQTSLFLFESKIIEKIVNNLKDEYNIIFKIHPAYLKKTHNDLYLCKDFELSKKINTDNIRINNKKYKALSFINNKKIIDTDFGNEIFKYTHFGIIFSNSTVTWEANMYKIPMLEISSRKKLFDFFNYGSKKLYTSDEIKKLNEYGYWNNEIDINNVVFGKKIYWEDIKNDIKNNLKIIFNKDYLTNYKYIKNHPIYKDSIISTQKNNGETIIDVINKHNFDIILNNVKYSLCDASLTVYQPSYIKVLLENNIITIELLKEPYINEKLVSSGVSIYIYNIDPLCKLNITFNVKIDTNEKDVYIRLYTGIKWIIYKDITLTTNFKTISLTEDFNLENNSQWRLTTTSRKVGQKITIKNLIIRGIVD